MEAINVKRVGLGGLVAALILVLGMVASEPFLAEVQGRWLAGLGVPEPGETLLVVMLLLSLVVGAVLVLLYAILKARYGPGAQTALMAAAVVWLLNCLAPNMGMMAYGLLPVQIFWIATLHDLIVIPLAALAGARIYRDATSVGFRARVVAG